MSFDPSAFKAYDVRGVYPTQLDEDVFYKLGHAYAHYVKPQGEVLVGHDVRLQSENLKKQLINGLIDAGVSVVDIGLISTDMYYFAVGNYDFAGGIQVTASHNPPEYHGAKMVREGVRPITFEEGISQMRDMVQNEHFVNSDTKGSYRKMDVLDDFCEYLLKWIDPAKVKPMKVVYNGNFGFAGRVFEHFVQKYKLPLTIIPLNAEPDGHFPKGRPDPFVPENRDEFVALVKSENADFGVAWDADADRVFFCADGGIFLEPYYTNTLLIKKMLEKYPGEKVIYDPRYTWALLDAIKNNGGIPLLCRVGHSYIKEMMREQNGIFAGESSGHTYYRDFWYADSGMIPLMQILELLSETNTPLSEMLERVMDQYVMSGEINSTVSDVHTVTEKLAERYADGEQSRLDGLAVEYKDYRFNVRPSNTEPLLRLNLEAKSKELMEQKRDEVLDVIRS